MRTDDVKVLSVYISICNEIALCPLKTKQINTSGRYDGVFLGGHSQRQNEKTNKVETRCAYAVTSQTSRSFTRLMGRKLLISRTGRAPVLDRSFAVCINVKVTFI